MTRPRFVQATLVGREVGAAYEGVIHDYFLMLRTTAGGELKVFDMEEPISEGLQPGRSYEFVLVVSFPSGLRQGFAGSPSRRWSGQVSTPRWRAITDELEIARPELTERDWVVVDCAIGAVLFNPRSAAQPFVAGEFVEWDDARWDLYGVIGSFAPST